EPLQGVRRALLERHAPDFLAVEDRMRKIRGGVPRLARSPLLYRTPYLVRDVCRFRAAAIALAFLEDELWPRPATGDAAPPGDRTVCGAMSAWRGLFAPDLVPYRSLDRTLMNLPDAVHPALVCSLRHVRLERAVVDPIELQLLLQCVALARQRREPIPW